MTFKFACRMGTLARPRMSGKSAKCPTYNFICRRLARNVWAASALPLTIKSAVSQLRARVW